MTRKDKLIAMSGTLLIGVADKLGVKVACNKSRTALKEAKLNVVERILAAEAQVKEKEVEQAIGEETANLLKNVIKDVEEAKETTEEPAEEPETVEAVEATPVEKKVSKKANLKLNELTYKGETKSIRAWAETLGMPWATLYDRVNRNGWPIEVAIETPLGQRRPKN